MKTVVIVAVAALSLGCVSTQERPMNKGEKTIVSDAVAQKVDDAGGRLDIRADDTVVCDRFKITGSHMVTRVCYTLAEKRALEKANQDRVNGRFGKQMCLDQTSLSCNGMLDEARLGGAAPR